MEEFRKKCFFCSKPINEKKTLEHIIPDSLLGALGIKEVKVSGERITQYSRIKVPAHSSCNNEFGSRYEDKILDLLNDKEALYETLKQEEDAISMIYSASDSTTALLTTWLSKIYYGLFYDDFLKTKDESWRQQCEFIISSDNFNFVQRSYEHGHGFQLPSSLYVFKTKNCETDLVTMVEPNSLLFKVGCVTLILCVCDGYLTKNYLIGESLNRLRAFVRTEDENNIDFPSHKLAFAEILAVRSCIPKTPKFVYGSDQIINMSFSTMASNPDEIYRIDMNQLKQARREILDIFNIGIDPEIA